MVIYIKTINWIDIMLNASNIHKAGHFFYKRKIPILPKLFYYINYFLFNSSIPVSAKIGKNSKFAYGGIGVVIHHNAEIGENVMIGQNVTIGGNFGPGKPKIIGNNVYIGAGSRIISSTIGNNVVIGVNSVIVDKNIPDNVVVAGVPGKIIGKYDPVVHKWLKNR